MTWDDAEVIAILNKVLADQNVLYIKTRNAHWNLVGPHFHDLHKLFEEQYEKLAADADMVAEHIRGRQGVALGSLEEMKTRSRLSEKAGAEHSGVEFAKMLLDDHEAIIAQLRDDIGATGEMGDDATQDLLIELARGHEKMAWMLRSVTK